MKKVHYKNQAIELTAWCKHRGKLSISQSFLKKIVSTVLSTAVFWQFFLIPGPYTHNFPCGETPTHNWCPQSVLLHYFAIKMVFKAFYLKQFSIILIGKSQSMRIISRWECINLFFSQALFVQLSSMQLAMLFVPQLSVIKYNCLSYWQSLN